MSNQNPKDPEYVKEFKQKILGNKKIPEGMNIQEEAYKYAKGLEDIQKYKNNLLGYRNIPEDTNGLPYDPERIGTTPVDAYFPLTGSHYTSWQTNPTAPTADLLLRNEYLKNGGEREEHLKGRDYPFFLNPTEEALANRGQLPGFWGKLFNKSQGNK